MYRKDSELHINVRREGGFSLSRFWKYFIHPLKENTNFLSNDKEQLPHKTAQPSKRTVFPQFYVPSELPLFNSLKLAISSLPNFLPAWQILSHSRTFSLKCSYWPRLSVLPSPITFLWVTVITVKQPFYAALWHQLIKTMWHRNNEKQEFTITFTTELLVTEKHDMFPIRSSNSTCNAPFQATCVNEPSVQSQSPVTSSLLWLITSQTAITTPHNLCCGSQSSHMNLHVTNSTILLPTILWHTWLNSHPLKRHLKIQNLQSNPRLSSTGSKYISLHQSPKVESFQVQYSSRKHVKYWFTYKEIISAMMGSIMHTSQKL